jgi:hypothetical protein
MALYADRVKQSLGVTGTGTITLTLATTGNGYQSFLTAFGTGTQTVAYCIADQSGPNWEVGTGTYNGSANTLARTTVLASSNGGSLTNFSGGTQDVFCTAPAKYLDTFTDTNQGVVPASGGGTSTFLRADATFAAPPTTAPASPTTSVQFNNAGAFGGSANFFYTVGTDTLTVGNLVAANFTSAAQGLVPASGGGTSNFLRADGSFAAPPATAPAGSTTQVQFNNAGAFGANAAFTWSTTTFTVGPAGGTVSINTVAPTSSQAAAIMRFVGRNAAQANGNGGGFAFAGGTGLGTGQGGSYAVTTGNCTNGSGGSVTFTTGGSTNGTGGSTTFTAGGGGVQGGFFSFSSGNGTGVNGTGGDFTMLSGDARGSGNGGNYLLTAGNNTDFVGSGGSFFLLPGYGGTTGSIYLQTPAGGDAMQVTDDGTSAQISFFGATPVAQPAAVPVTAAGIHAALVSLGLIT